jgi:threonine aldolase
MIVHKIDLRSDTVTKPTPEMRKAMLEAEVGDDVYAEDPTVNKLQSMIAELFGKESALFVPTGVMGNQIAIAVHSKRSDEIIVESESHIFHYETAAPAIIAGVQMYCIPSLEGEMSIASINDAIRPGDYYFPKSALICIEQTHNRHGGTIASLSSMKEMHAFAKNNTIPIHCDGARIWNACAETGIAPDEYAKNVDTLSVCLSKGLGAPVGSVFIGSKDQVEYARHWRKLLGGGMRQAGILAAAGIHAIQHHRKNLKEDHEKARRFAELIVSQTPCTIANSSGSVETNILIIDCGDGCNPQALQNECKKNGLEISSGRGQCLRAVFHRDISMEDTLLAAKIFIQSVERIVGMIS